ncbi:hypothetical protein [Anaerolactibacter massiliensis]|uniref:hypothetical protein n=1 Tax=Anaerolactibacter massiliensis TaxID=2044573 RepID=UPI000CF9797B|nr:hypothetical protein [Anaerolactibacter massiliensis]
MKKIIAVIISLFACIMTITPINASQLISEEPGEPVKDTDYAIRTITGYTSFSFIGLPSVHTQGMIGIQASGTITLDANNQGVSASIIIDYGPKEYYSVATSYYISGSRVIVNYTATAKVSTFDPHVTSGSFVVS